MLSNPFIYYHVLWQKQLTGLKSMVLADNVAHLLCMVWYGTVLYVRNKWRSTNGVSSWNCMLVLLIFECTRRKKKKIHSSLIGPVGFSSFTFLHLFTFIFVIFAFFFLLLLFAYYHVKFCNIAFIALFKSQ